MVKIGILWVDFLSRGHFSQAEVFLISSYYRTLIGCEIQAFYVNFHFYIRKLKQSKLAEKEIFFISREETISS
jgi:hypothetical protein